MVASPAVVDVVDDAVVVDAVCRRPCPQFVTANLSASKSIFIHFPFLPQTKGYQVYVVELVVEAAVCANRNIHERSLDDLTKICSNWVKTPDHMINLDVRTLLQDDAIEEVEMEMEDANDNDNDNTTADDDDKNNDNKDSPNGAQSSAKEGSGDDKAGINNEGDEDEDDNNDEGFRKVIRSKWDGDVSETNLGKQWAWQR